MVDVGSSSDELAEDLHVALLARHEGGIAAILIHAVARSLAHSQRDEVLGSPHGPVPQHHVNRGRARLLRGL